LSARGSTNSKLLPPPSAQIPHRPPADLGHVAEGVASARAVATLAQRNKVEMPITEAVVALLDGSVSPREAVESLLARDPKPEQAG
jgi:glycerol-3-phosphate dehydrogenase